MRLNRTSEWNVMTIWISRELPFFNFERLYILCAWIWHLSEKLWHLKFSRASVVQFRVSLYVMLLNRSSWLKVLTIWISQELSLFNFERLDILYAWIEPPSEKLWQFEFLESFCCWISSVSIYYAPESDIRVKSYDHLNLSREPKSVIWVKIFYHLNFPRASVVQFRASLYIMRLNLTSEWKVMTIWNSREPPLFNFEFLYMWCS